MLILDRGFAHYNADLAFDACLALVRDLPALVRLAILDLHEQEGIHYGMLSLTIAKVPQEEELRRTAMETFFNASVGAARAVDFASEAAAYYSIGNFYRARNDQTLAFAHYNQARKLRPVYLETGYFLSELGGILFSWDVTRRRQRPNWVAASKSSDNPITIFLLADALLLAGFVAAAAGCFEQAISFDAAHHAYFSKAKLKIMICHHLIETTGAAVVPRRRNAAALLLNTGGRDLPAHLENLSREVDAINPLARFNLGVSRAAEGDQKAALYHFLLCAIVQPHDIEAWANAVICAMSLDDELLRLGIISVAIHHMGTAAYDHLRQQLVTQLASPDKLAALDELAMRLLEENEQRGDDGFTMRILDGDSYHSFTVLGTGTA